MRDRPPFATGTMDLAVRPALADQVPQAVAIEDDRDHVGPPVSGWGLVMPTQFTFLSF